MTREKKTYNIKKFLLGLTILLLALPAIQHITNIPKMRALKGAIEEVHYKPFESKKWFSGDYARDTEKYLANNMGYRPNLVRMDNQLAYSFFGETRAQNITIGKDNYLYENNYINAYTGKDFLGENIIKGKVKKLKTIQDSLSVLGKQLLIILAPGKASFYPEYIPDEMMLGANIDSTNYFYFRNELKKQEVNHLDFMDWFLANKGKMRYPLYPKTGIHWSEYGMVLAADSILNHVERLNSEWNLPEIYWEEVDFVDERRETDDDIELALNLIGSFPNHKMAYPKVQFDTENKDSLNAIMISDSFFWRMFSLGVMPKGFTNGQFWYYNYQSFPEQFKVETKVSELNLQEQIEQVDIIMMMATEGNLHSFPWGADEQFYDYFIEGYDFQEIFLEKKIKKMEGVIRENEQWVKDLGEKAKTFGISLDSMIRRDAIYMLEQAKK